jgi:primosomal protein N' (replication factor Y)
MKKIKYYEIAPLVKLPPKTKSFFTYAADEDNLERSLVLIPFAQKKLKGVVLKKTARPYFRTKKILSVLENNCLTNNQLVLAKKISASYFSNLNTVLRFFVFSKTKKAFPPKFEEVKKEKFSRLTQKQQAAYEKIKTSGSREFLLFGPASSGKTEIIMRLIKDVIENKKQALVIVPEIFLSYHEIDRYRKRFGQEKVALYHSAIKRSEASYITETCREGKLSLVIATKIGLFLPFKDLGLVVIDEEQDVSHKQWDLFPRYHVRNVASLLAKIFDAKLIYASATPSLETVHRFVGAKKEESFVELPMLKKNNLAVKKPDIKKIDLRKIYYTERNKNFFSQELLVEIRQKNQDKKMVFILVPRRGKNRITVCENCRKTLLCPNCQNPLIQINDQYCCSYCNFKKSIFSKCDYCGGFRFKNIGFGTEKIVESLRVLFPKTCIGQADQTIFSKNIERKNLLKRIRNNQIDILVGTQNIIKGFDFPNLGLVAILNAEDWSGKNDYRHDERKLSALFQLAGRVNRPGSSQKGKFLIQSYHPENRLFDFLSNWDWLSFAKRELTERKLLKFPPFYVLIKITYLGTNLKKVEKNAERMYNELIKKEIIASEPYWDTRKKKGDFYKKNILIRIKNGHFNKYLKKIFNQFDSHWQIDIEPENIF